MRLTLKPLAGPRWKIRVLQLLPMASQLLGLTLDPWKVPAGPGAHRTNVANGIWPGLLCLAPVQQWGYKKPRHHLIAVSSKKETFSLQIPAEDTFLLAVWPGREQEERKREAGEFSPSWGYRAAWVVTTGLGLALW